MRTRLVMLTVAFVLSASAAALANGSSGASVGSSGAGAASAGTGGGVHGGASAQGAGGMHEGEMAAGHGGAGYTMLNAGRAGPGHGASVTGSRADGSRMNLVVGVRARSAAVAARTAPPENHRPYRVYRCTGPACPAFNRASRREIRCPEYDTPLSLVCFSGVKTKVVRK
jgi:hypothetical protein